MNKNIMYSYEKDYPKLLVISNCPLSKTNSNGRTLSNFLNGWPKNNLAHFFVKKTDIDFTLCNNLYCISDSKALRAIFKPRIDGRVTETISNVSSINRERRVRKNAINKIIRECVWNSRRWMNDTFVEWIEGFSPDVILLYAGDSGFMLRLARDLSEKYNIPLVMYNCEVYYYKDFYYLKDKDFLSYLFFPIFKKYFCKEYKKTMDICNKVIYSCDEIKQLYDNEFGIPSTAIYTATSILPMPRKSVKEIPTISYLGNLGVGRHESLIEIAEIIQKINGNCYLDIYGTINDENVANAFNSCTGIRYKGFVPYSKVLEVMEESDILIHAENFSEYYQRDSQYAFSTKIADCLGSGRCFVIYASDKFACTQYLSRNEAAYIVTDKATLTSCLEQLLCYPESRDKYIDSALKLVEENHRMDKNSSTFQNVLVQEGLKGKCNV